MIKNFFIREKGGVRGFLLNLLGVLIFLGLALFWWRRHWEAPPVTSQAAPPSAASAAFQGDPSEATQRLLKVLNQQLQDMDLLKLLEKDVQAGATTLQGKVFPSYEESFRMPQRYSAAQLAEALGKAAKSCGAQVVATESPEGGPHLDFTYDSQWTPVRIDFEAVKAPRICLIIDDGGYQRGGTLQALYGLKVPVTVSIIPDVEFSKSLAEEFPGHGVEVMCHMPMEGHEKGVVGNDYKALLKKGMDPALAEKDVEEALDDLPNCRGLNNHMGSVATEDPQLIGAVCAALKDRGLFIIDSRTTSKSVVEQVAHQANIPVADRDVFLDNVETPEAILAQLDKTAAHARKHGLAVAIGHFKLVTLQTLETALPKLKDAGYQFVYASEVVK